VSTPTPAQPEVPAPATRPAPTPVAAPSAGAADPIAARIASGREVLANGGNQFAVQLMVTDARERTYLGTYLAEASQALTPAKVFLAQAGTLEAPRFGVLYGPFRARSEALDALNALPTSLRQFGPYVRSLEALRDEARRLDRK
jgi:septal ring-binding cell division protein DamX